MYVEDMLQDMLIGQFTAKNRYNSSTFPGFMIPFGSKRCLIFFIHSMLTAFFEYGNACVFITPMPCSAEIEPLYLAAKVSA